MIALERITTMRDRVLASVRGQTPAPPLRDCIDRAIDAERIGRSDLAIEILHPLSMLSDVPAQLWQILGVAYRSEQRTPEALHAFSEAARRAPRDARIAIGRATVTMEAGLPAARLFGEALVLSNGDPEVILSSVAALLAEKEARVAEQLLERALAIKPAWIRGHQALAALRWQGGDRESFTRSFVDAAFARPDDPFLRLAHFRAHAQAGEWAVADRVIAAAISAMGERTEFVAAQAYIATESGDDARAERCFAATQTLDDAGTRISEIRHSLRTGQVDRAAAIAQRLLKRPAAAAAWPYMSLIWRLQNDDRARWLDGDAPFVGVYDLGFTATELESLAGSLRRLHLSRHHPAEQSLRGGTQTDGPLFAAIDPPIRDAHEKILGAVRRFVDTLPDRDPDHPLLAPPRGRLAFAGSWSVRLGQQGFHVHHTHPLGWISSAFYVATPTDAARGPDRSGWLHVGAPPPDLRLDLPPYAEIEPKPGRLVLFPSTMWHGTIPFDAGERLTISCDIAVPTR